MLPGATIQVHTGYACGTSVLPDLRLFSRKYVRLFLLSQKSAQNSSTFRAQHQKSWLHFLCYPTESKAVAGISLNKSLFGSISSMVVIAAARLLGELPQWGTTPVRPPDGAEARLTLPQVAINELNPFTPKLKKKHSPKLSERKCVSDVVRIG